MINEGAKTMRQTIKIIKAVQYGNQNEVYMVRTDTNGATHNGMYQLRGASVVRTQGDGIQSYDHGDPIRDADVLAAITRVIGSGDREVIAWGPEVDVIAQTEAILQEHAQIDDTRRKMQRYGF
jgi:hypothetical protein